MIWKDMPIGTYYYSVRKTSIMQKINDYHGRLILKDGKVSKDREITWYFGKEEREYISINELEELKAMYL